MPQVMVVARNFMDMVAALPAAKLDMLYDSAFICEAVLRSFPPLAKKYVIQMLYVSAPMPAAAMQEWVLDEYASKHKVAIDRLLQLRVFVEVRDRRKEVSYKMNNKFQANMQKYLVSGGCLPREPLPFSVTGRLPTLVELENYALDQWEERGVDPTDLISFLLELSFHTQGACLKEVKGLQDYIYHVKLVLHIFLFRPCCSAYSLSTLTEVQRVAIMDLMELGLVKLQQGIVVVETNFRLYAYSASKLHCEILRLFSRVEYQLPNLIVGAITKESLYGAFDNGITAEQIISFLQQNAHPRVIDKIPIVPENVTDQIRLWENDRNRVEMVLSHVYEDFPSKDMFEQCCDHARDNGYLLWEDAKKMRLIVNAEFHQEMREFLRRQR
uniref:RNA polymerase II transcription factor B subunit 2 n=1 Tax=Aegilops tauschii TaxID=37682 RepID=M8C0S4_AEGTA